MKKLFLYLLMFTIILLNNMLSLHAMELIQPAGVKIDWGYKKRELDSFCCYGEKNAQEYPYFFDKNDDKTKFPFVSDKKITKKYKKCLGGIYDISLLSNDQGNALWYVLTMQHDKTLRVEGRDKNFAQQMSQRILDLPAKIKQEIAQKYDVEMFCNINYKQSEWNALLDDEGNKRECAHKATKWGMIGCHTLSQFLTVNDMISCKGFCCIFSIAAMIYLPYAVYDEVMSRLEETPEQRDKRHGFEAIPLLKVMESKIVDVDAKEKVD